MTDEEMLETLNRVRQIPLKPIVAQVLVKVKLKPRITSTELSVYLDVSCTAVTYITTKLRELGYIKMTERYGPIKNRGKDSRKSFITITHSGEKALANMSKILSE